MGDKNYYEIGSAIDMSPFIKTKGNVKYISWSDMYGQVRKLFPDMTYKIYENVISKTSVSEDGTKRTTVIREPFFKTENGNSAWVKVGVKLAKEVEEVIEIYPIMDFKNKSIPAENVTMTDTNKAIQRALCKCMSRASGCGLYIYSGSDLPVEMKETSELQQKCLDLIMKKGKMEKLKDKVAETSKKILPEECNGDPRLCDDTDILETLKKKLMALR